MNATDEALPPPVIAPGGFPTWLPSMLVKELRQGLRARGFVGAFIAFETIVGLLMLAAVILVPLEKSPATRTQMLSAVDSAFWMMVSIMLLMITLGRAMVGLKTEIENRSVDLLVLSHLTAWRIVVGKWASLMAQATLLLIALLPFAIVRYFTGAVDLAGDAVRCGLLLVGAGVLTAAGLWASGLPRIAGIGILLVVFMSQGLGGVGIVRMTMIGASGALSTLAGFVLPTLVCAFLVLALCLLNAVRRIAPPAENYSNLARGLGLLALLPVAVASALGANSDIRTFLLFFGLIYAGVVCLIELSSNQLPMAVHCRRFAPVNSRVPHLLSVLGLPGWQTAIWYTAIACAVALPIVLIPSYGSVSARDQRELAWLIVLVFGALMFPASVISVFRRITPSGRNYFIVIGAMSLLGALAVFLDETMKTGHAFAEVAALLPVTGVWFSMENFTEEISLFQGIGIAAVFLVAALRSKPYWTRVSELARRKSGRIPGAKPPPPPAEA